MQTRVFGDYKPSNHKMENVSSETKGDTYWWHKVECHLSPRWRLPDLDQYMLETIKNTYRFEFNLEILPDFMTIERLLFAAWVDLSQLSYGEASSKAVDLVQQANTYRMKKFDNGDNAFTGYGTIVYGFLMWIYHKSGSTKDFKKAEEKLKELCRNDLFQSESKKLVPSYQVYIDVTHAWALGRLGSEKRCKALRLLDNALGVRDKKIGRKQWLFAKALIQAQGDRGDIYFDDCQKYEPSNLLEMLSKEKQTLEKVTRKKKPRFDLAKVHLATTITALENTDSSLKAERALRSIRESLHDECPNAELALILARLNTYLNKTNMLQDILQYCENEINIARENRPSDVYLQLGLLYYKQGKLTNKTSMMDKALDMVKKAVQRDRNHVKARLWEATILANPHNNNSEGAKEIFFKIQQDNYSNKATELHILTCISSSSVRSIYEPLQYLQNVFKFLLLCVEHHVRREYLGALRFESVVRKDALQRMEILQNEVESDSSDKKIKNYAILYLAKITLQLERYTQAEDLFKLLKSDVSSAKELETEVECGLAECFYRLGKFQDLKKLDDVDREDDGMKSRQDIKKIKELLYLARGKEKEPEMMAKCEEAIELGSLDGCLLMLNMHQHFQEKFFAFRERFAHRLAKIKLCIERNGNKNQQASNQNQDNKGKVKQIVAEKIDSILMFCQRGKIFHDSHESVYLKLTEIRRLLLKFEYCLLLENNSCSTKDGFLKCADRQCDYTKQQFSRPPVWSVDCSNAAVAVLSKTRFLLDEVMACLQIAVIGYVHCRSEFPIIADRVKGHKDKEKAIEKLQTRLSKSFTRGNELYIPELVFDCLLKIQPIFDEENEWLGHIFSYNVNKMKHRGLMFGPVCQNSNGTFQLCTSYLARRGCEEVEKISLFLLNQCAEMM